MTLESTNALPFDLLKDHEHIPAASRLYHGGLGSLVAPLHRAGRLWRKQTVNPRSLARARALVPSILTELPVVNDLPAPSELTVLRATWTITDVAVIGLGRLGEEPVAFIKLPGTREGMVNLQHQESVLSTLHADTRLGDWRRLVPRPWASGSIDDRAYLVERAVPGVELRSLGVESAVFANGLHGAAVAVSELHERTASQLEVNAAVLDRWVDVPLALMKRLSTVLPRPERIHAAAESIGEELRAVLTGRSMQVGWVHGDFWTSNVLVAADGTVTGVVDWERAAPFEPAFHDRLHLVLHTPRLQATRSDLGGVVRSLLDGSELNEDEWRLLSEEGLQFPATSAGLRLMLLLYWMRYVATYLSKVPDQARNPWWVRRNIGDVLLAGG